MIKINAGESLLVTMDVESLYTNIDHVEGLEAVEHFLSDRSPESVPPTTIILQLMEWTLKNNVFLFQDVFYKQMKGTAMGACFSPNYANLFLGLWEERYIYSTHNSFLDNIVMWGRYIDDVLIIWSGSESELHRFHQYINGINRNLKLSLEYSVSEINFLDLKITKEANGVLHTSIFRKPTDRNTILRANSFHPPWLIENIPHGQFQRLKRTCDREDDYEIQLQDMTSRFRQRGYDSRVLTRATEKVGSIDRNQLLCKKKKKSATRLQ